MYEYTRCTPLGASETLHLPLADTASANDRLSACRAVSIRQCEIARNRGCRNAKINLASGLYWWMRSIA